MGLLCLLMLYACIYGHDCNNSPYTKDAEPLVTTSSGTVVGKYVQVSDTKVAAFLGIPYAQPPINDNRFLKPKPLERWEGKLDATQNPPSCMQYSTKNYDWFPKTDLSEDCLYLNIWMPAKYCCSTSERLPVLVWIYGGGFYAGSTAMDIYDGSTIASFGEVIVVSINYRVGVFGFLKDGSEKAPGNMGLQDQSLGIKWVKKNIEFFGGDANSITLFGESAGGLSVNLHMLSPMSRNLFNRAIIQSNSALSALIDESKIAYSKANGYAKTVGCIGANSSIESDPKVVECLRGKDALELAKAESVLLSKNLVYFLPSYEDEFLPVSPKKYIAEGNIAPVDVLIGNTVDEATIFLNLLIPNIFKLENEPKLNLSSAERIIGTLFDPFQRPSSKEIFEQYFQTLTDNDSTEIVKAISHAFGDFLFHCPVKFFGEKMSKGCMYWYNYKSTKNQRSDWVGVTHFDEVAFVFGVPIRDTKNYTSEDGRFSKDLIQKWSTFAKTGHPLGLESSEEWPTFTAEHPDAFELSSGPGGIIPYPRTAACEYWRPYVTL